MAPAWFMLPDARHLIVRHTGHSSGCSFTATPVLLCGVRSYTVGVSPRHGISHGIVSRFKITRPTTEISRLIVNKLQLTWGF